MGFLSKLFGPRSNRVREEAVRLGVAVSELERDIPIFSRDMESVELRRGTCVCYSIPRASGKTSWQLLQRTKASGATLPSDYLLSVQGVLPEPLVNELHSVAERYSEEYFEFEATPTRVSVYWEEWGGPEKAIELHATLARLAML